LSLKAKIQPRDREAAMPESPLNPREYGHYVTIAQVGLEMGACVGVGLILDRYLDWAPWGVVGGAVFGLIAGIAHLAALANRRDDDSQHRRDQS
jgi:F0F1-type ATP synthase assembly protein I